ncbi:MAG: hypothetical protein IPN39_17060 [Chitinophagaceae bacterium]|nr:hypothetical protein [Chitinophagaceae bacterium]
MKLIWKDVFASKTENGLDVHFEKLGNEFFSLYQTLQANPDVHFSLTPSQQLQFNQFFEKNANPVCQYPRRRDYQFSKAFGLNCLPYNDDFFSTPNYGRWRTYSNLYLQRYRLSKHWI